FGAFDDHIVSGDVLVTGTAGGAHAFDLLDHVHAFADLAEYGIAPTLGGRRGVVEEGIVSHVDEELGAGGMRVHGAGHGNGADSVADAIVGLVLDRRAGVLLLHARLETAALDHEVTDDAMEDSVVVVT